MRILLYLFLSTFLFSCDPASVSNDLEIESELKETRIIYLIRHSKSSHEDTSLVDFDRPLLKKGKDDASMIGEKLTERGIVIDKMITSPAKRSRKTAKRIAKKLNFDTDSIVHDSSIYICRTRKLI